MANILIIGEQTDNALNAAVAKCVTCARDIDGAEIHVLLLGSSIDQAAATAASIEGVAKVLTIDAAHNANPLAAVYAPQIAEVAGGYDYVFGPSTTFGKDLVPRVAALLDVNQLSDIMEVVDARTFKRPIYAGNAITTVTVKDGYKVLATVRAASYRASGEQAAAPIEAVSTGAEIPAHSRFVSVQTGASDRPDLQTAAKVVSGGRALGSEEAFKIIYDFADKLGAGVGASRAAVDAGYVPNELQVGQTGKIIAPELYVAIGISGAIQHLTGIKDAGTIVAINKDEDAPIFEVADIGLVGDLFKVIPEIEAALGA
ncbi:MAG: FAD-binding protein [Pseudomonadota bacterium]